MLKKYAADLRRGILGNIHHMLKPAEGALRHPFIDPGGQYSKNLWDWDSYWASVALCRILKNPKDLPAGFRDEVFCHIKGAVSNFFDHQGKDGSLPICMLPKDPDVFKCRVRPGEETNMGKPVFGQFLRLILKETGDQKLVGRLFPKLLKYYACYRKRYLHRTGLFVWGSDMAIAVDDDPAVFARPHFSAAGIFLNSMMVADLAAAAETAKKLQQTKAAEQLTRQTRDLAAAVRKYCWDERDGFFYTVDIQCKRHMLLGWVHENLEPTWQVLPLKVMGWCGFLPLWAGIATPQQARRMVNDHLFNEKRFLAPAGIRSLSADEPMYDPLTARGNPSNWLGPVWIITQYLVWQGLLNYGMKKEAAEIARRTITLLGKDIKAHGCLHEYYDPKTGKGLLGKGFWNWNNLVVFMLPEK